MLVVKPYTSLADGHWFPLNETLERQFFLSSFLGARGSRLLTVTAVDDASRSFRQDPLS